MSWKKIYFISQIVFEAIRGSGFKGDIAIDDISTSIAPCPSLPFPSLRPITTSAPITGGLYALTSYLT